MLFYRAQTRPQNAGSARVWLVGATVGSTAGFVGGLLGVGGGNIIVPALNWLGLDAKRAAATCAVAVVFSSLSGFIGHASFAKLPAPRLAAVAWPPFLDALALHCRFRLLAEAPERPGIFDAVQIEQVLINLIKNAHEAGGDEDEVSLAITQAGRDLRIEVADRGPGMSETVLAQALLPFYSTKRAGTGLGLALAREITEAHGGRVLLANREGGGLRVTLVLPQTTPR